MKTIYISSTYDDLKKHREAAYSALKKMQYHVIAMEDYVAKDKRTVKNCLDDVAKCDFYIGIFAKRYGWIPPEEDNPEGKSITELEYRKAREKNKHCLLFLLDPEAIWSEGDTETNPKKSKLLEKFLNELKPQSPALFHNPDDLEKNVMASVHIAEAEVPLGFLPVDLQAGEPIPDAADAANAENDAEQIPPMMVVPNSYIPSIRSSIEEAIKTSKAKKVTIVNLGHGQSWWSTRLHLLAAMLADYTTVEQIAFSGQKGCYLGMLPPKDVRRELTSYFPETEIAYRESLPKPAARVFDCTEEISEIVANFENEMAKRGGERNVKKWVAPYILKEWNAFIGERIELAKQDSKLSLLQEIVSQPSPFVALVGDGRLAHMLDRVSLTTRIAENALR